MGSCSGVVETSHLIVQRVVVVRRDYVLVSMRSCRGVVGMSHLVLHRVVAVR